jgi:hypothetical protein
MAPADVTQDDVRKIKVHMYPASVVKEPKFNIGDSVRISKQRGPFQKGYAPGWTEEIFTVVEILQRDPPVYRIKDFSGETLEGTFYAQEMQKIYKPADATYIVEKILDKKQAGRQTEYLIKWQGYPESMASWEPESNIVLL